MSTRVVVGAGAQGRVVLENWRSAHPGDRFVFVDDDASLRGATIHGADVVGPLAALAELTTDPDARVVLAIGNNRTRLALAERLERDHPRLRWGVVVSRTATVMPSAEARIGPGTVIFAGAVVNTDAELGAHVVVNTGVVVEHDAVVGRGASLSPGTKSGGRIVVGEGAFVATGVTLAPRVNVGAWSIVGAGSVVVRDVPRRTLAYGVPARVVGEIDDGFDWGRLL